MNRQEPRINAAAWEYAVWEVLHIHDFYWIILVFLKVCHFQHIWHLIASALPLRIAIVDALPATTQKSATTLTAAR